MALLHTWGQTLQHHLVGGVLPAGTLPSRRFRTLFLAQSHAAFVAGELHFSETLAALAEPSAFAERLGALRAVEWVVYPKRPFAGPEQMLAYLGRHTHRVALANSRLTRLADGQVDFTWKDHRQHGKTKVMTLAADEFIRRFLLHAIPDGFHRIRHVGFLANGHRTATLMSVSARSAADRRRDCSPPHSPARSNPSPQAITTAMHQAICAFTATPEAHTNPLVCSARSVSNKTPIASLPRGSDQSGFNEVAIRALGAVRVARPYRSLQIPRRGVDVIHEWRTEEVRHASTDLIEAGYDATRLRRIACGSEDADQVRRLLALAAVYEGSSRTEAAEIGGGTVQVVRDWVLQFNVHGPEGLVDRRVPGQPSRLSDEHCAALVAMVENGPIPAVHDVVRWRIIDLCQWLWDEYEITASKQTLSRELGVGLPQVVDAPTSSRVEGGCRRGFQENWPATLATIAR